MKGTKHHREVEAQFPVGTEVTVDDLAGTYVVVKVVTQRSGHIAVRVKASTSPYEWDWTVYPSQLHPV